MNLVHEGVLPPDEIDDRDERRELAEALLTKPAENVNSGAGSDSRDNNGNAANLREALDEILSYIESFHKYITPDKGKELTALFAVADTIRNKARAALSAPARNCERFATADDAKREFNYLWNFVWQRGGGCLAERNYVEEFERWLFAPATEQEGGEE